MPILKKIKVELDLSNYATKSDLKSTTDIDKLDIHKLQTTLVGLSKLSDVVKIMLLKRLYMINW